MWRKVVLIQIIICIFLIAGYVISGNSDSEIIKEMRCQLVAAVSVHHSVSDILNYGKDAAATLINAPTTVTDYVLNGHEEQKYAEPIDPVVEGGITSVYAVSGGQVVETGENNKYGKYIKIQHDKAVSIYGKCCRIYAKEGKHVRRGQVIASYVQDKNNQFYYELIKE